MPLHYPFRLLSVSSGCRSTPMVGSSTCSNTPCAMARPCPAQPLRTSWRGTPLKLRGRWLRRPPAVSLQVRSAQYALLSSQPPPASARSSRPAADIYMGLLPAGPQPTLLRRLLDSPASGRPPTRPVGRESPFPVRLARRFILLPSHTSRDQRNDPPSFLSSGPNRLLASGNLLESAEDGKNRSRCS